MAFNLSAGVYWKEIDLSQYAPALGTTSFGIVGTATKGPFNKRTLITNHEQLVQTFGYLTPGYHAMYAAWKYLEEGQQLYFIRIQSTATPAVVASATVTMINSATVTLNAKDAGTFYNGITAKVEHGNAAISNQKLLGSAATTAGTVLTFNLGAPLVKKVLVFKSKIGAGAETQVGADTTGSGTFTGTGFTATINYNTGVVVVTYGAAVGASDEFTVYAQKYTTFNLSLEKTVGGTSLPLERFVNLTMTADRENTYTEVLKRSFLLAPVTFAAMPQVGSYAMANGTDGLTGLVDADYIGIVTGATKTGLQLFSSAEEVDVNTVAIPGLSSDAIRQAVNTLVETRRDLMGLVDPPVGLSPMDVADWINGANTYSSYNSLNSSYLAAYYPWVKIYDSFNAQEVTIPPSGCVAAAFARNDRVADVFYAPAGGTRGKVLGAIGTERILSEGERSFLYQNRINPISDFVATGILIWGQKTTQVFSSSLDRIVARRTLNYLEKIIVTALQPLVFEPNNQYTWSRARSLVQPILNSYVKKGGLYMGEFVCNENTNTPEVVNRNEMVCNCFLQLPKTAEVITVNFILLPYGANISEYIGRQF